MSTCPLCNSKLQSPEKVLEFKRGPKESVDRIAIQRLKDRGVSVRKIAKILNCAPSTVFTATRKKV